MSRAPYPGAGSHILVPSNSLALSDAGCYHFLHGFRGSATPSDCLRFVMQSELRLTEQILSDSSAVHFSEGKKVGFRFLLRQNTGETGDTRPTQK